MIMDVMNPAERVKKASVLCSTRPRLLPTEALAFRPIGYVADRVATEPRIPAPPGPVAEKPCCGAVRSLSFRKISGLPRIHFNVRSFVNGRLHSLWFSIDLRPVSADLTSSR